MTAIVAPEKLKSYDELRTRLDYVLGIKGTPRLQDQETVEEELQFRSENRAEPAPSVPQSMKEELTDLSSNNADEEDDTLSYFQRLADG